ncbi:formamidopyrimidine-DNA glycosylase [Companilactobacillus sp. RD055328]|uniref:bifunctional DNA-formamidopyrimidine glycosylase/DNA-(apurinic or apyrimidinic site) lyase n=1 Tax=Companilactobacillus sp. RD055328 TaxID=2916634 RepID=UPI001FC8396B|nr:bifunctional DNA-formamidopyrimidine glycosylase/DNA-(apurinic or apyrimidinic site) lyase [Companilactobacillus sp. RD055328]GKQ42501.1 formamidopyrimidine-DNA glycosylase [Companilactobacillus sp. RD055328]
MPEMPEVETVRRGLIDLVKNKTISSIEMRYPAIINGDKKEFSDILVGAKIIDIRRRAKFLIFDFDNNYSMLSHLRMEGKYQVRDNVEDFDKHVHIIFKFSDGDMLGYRDVRKFGRMQLFKTDEIFNSKSLTKLGPEPLSTEFTFDNIYPRIIKRKKSIKAVLLDQNVISGLGNIYVDEVLWMSKIHPETIANKLTKADIQNIIKASNEEIKKAIEAGGTTIRSYVDSKGNSGTFQFGLNAYDQEGNPCKRCGTTIEKIKVSGRGTHFCPNCQKVVE